MEQAHAPKLDSDICCEVTRLVTCPLDELAQRLHGYSWAQVSAAVDRLSRQGTLTLTRTKCFGHVVSLGPIPPPFQPSSSRDRMSRSLYGRPG